MRDRPISAGFGAVLASALLCATSASAQQGAHGDATPDPMSVMPITPAVSGRSVYVAQIGNGNLSDITQRSTRARAVATQAGDDHSLILKQAGRGSAYARIAQSGTAQQATVAQDGSGTASLLLTQAGAGNTARVTQATAGALYNAAVVTQTGIGNSLSLLQTGEDNRATLSQQGDGNVMNPVQTGAGNRLTWIQQGNGLPDLGIVQDGGQAMSITQTGGR